MPPETAFQISAMKKGEFIEVTISGEVTKETIALVYAEMYSLLEKANAKACICNIRITKGHKDNLSKVFFRIRNHPTHIKRLPTAVVEPDADPVYVSFFETASANTGHKVKWFSDTESARGWLTSQIQ